MPGFFVPGLHTGAGWLRPGWGLNSTQSQVDVATGLGLVQPLCQPSPERVTGYSRDIPEANPVSIRQILRPQGAFPVLPACCRSTPVSDRNGRFLLPLIKTTLKTIWFIL